jgi:putative redox protein
MEFVAANEDGATVSLSNESSDFRPSAVLLAALAGCTGMDAISIMTKKRQQVARYEVEAVGRQREDYPRTFTAIVVTHLVEGAALDDAAIRRAIELSARKYCLVGANLASGDASINHQLRIVDERGEREHDCVTIGPLGAGLALRGT